MRPRLIAIYLLMVLCPLGLLGWLGWRMLQDQQESVRRQVQLLLEDELAELQGRVGGVLQRREAELLDLAEGALRVVARERGRGAAAVDVGPPPPPDSRRKNPPPFTGELRDLVRRSGIIRHLLVLGPDCGRVHPPLQGGWSAGERRFLDQLEPVWSDLQALCRGQAEQDAANEQAAQQTVAGETSPPPDPWLQQGAATASRTASHHGWHSWQWGGGAAELLFWRRSPDGGLVCADLNTLRLLADIIGELPASSSDSAERRRGLIVLREAGGRALYQWGAHQPEAGGPPTASISLRPPLGAWRLDYHLDRAELERSLAGTSRITLLSTVVAAALALLLLAGYFYQQNLRQVREASQRVSFVNRVSHELRTPLTNIRLYAELLEGQLDADDERAQELLGVVVAESGRLSRLIANVLTFSRSERGALRLRPVPAVPDEVVGDVLDVFRPALAERGVRVELGAGAGREVRLDTDALEQILGNLLSNVEKYAASGGLVEVCTELQGEQLRLEVADRGPGIPPGLAGRVFEPFFRVSDRLTDPGTGTGLGLGIARELARLHGGDLRLLPTAQGATFSLTLAVGVGDGGRHGEPGEPAGRVPAEPS